MTTIASEAVTQSGTVARASFVACAHCSQPVPESRTASNEEANAYCCAGCEAVWHVLHECGLERYYELQKSAGSAANRPQGAQSHAYLDHAEFQSRHVQRVNADLVRVDLRLDGIKCGACMWLLEALPRIEHGVTSARVDLGRSIISIEWIPARVELSQIADRVTALGYAVRPIGTLASRQEWRRQDRRWLIDIAVAGAISGNVMAIAFALYGAQLTWMDDPTRQFLQWVSLALATLAVVWPGRVFLRNAWAAIATRRPHMDLPIALALVAGLIGGAIITATGQPGVYFESIGMLVWLLLIGRFVQFRQQRSARHEIELICALVPQTARRVLPTGVEEVPVDALCKGECVEVFSGESICADGVLESNEASLDMQLLTGESRPMRVGAGESVYAGVRLVSTAPIRIRVTAAGSTTRAAAIANMVQDAASKRPPTVEFANRIAGWFVLAVLVVTAIVGCVWAVVDPSRVLSVVIAMLVVTCPCALGLATPLTMMASLGKAARAGILVRGGDVLERLASAGTLILDKTGTVTEGSMRVVRMYGDSQAIQLAAALEAKSAHPVARAIQACAVGGEAHLVDDVNETIGRGITGRVGGKRVEVGNAALLASISSSEYAVEFAESQRMVHDGLSPIFVRIDGCVRAVLGVGDPIRKDAAALVRGFQTRGWKVCLASGDDVAITAQVGAALAIAPAQVRGRCTPEEKVAIAVAQTQRPVVMVGDGVNDLPAMAASDVGVAVRQGAQTTVAHADVALTGAGLAQLFALVDGAHQTIKTVHVNFAISLAYNLVGGALAATGTISPLIAAILMPLSGLTVTAVALRMPRFRVATLNPPREVAR